MKERYAVSQMRKQANRMTFGEVHAHQCTIYYTLASKNMQYYPNLEEKLQ